MDATAGDSSYRAIGSIPKRSKQTYPWQLPCRLHPLGVADSEKKADVVEHPEVFDHVGLLVSEPSGAAGLPFT